jgi:DNA polymerase III delta prime subunit
MSDSVLPIKLRPRRLSELVGQKTIVESIRKQFASSRVPRAWMIYGPSGCGKTTIARILALSFQIQKPEDGEFGEPTDALWQRYEEFQIAEINASQINGVEALGKIAEESQYLPTPPSRSRVYILDEAQRISDAAQNLLLKHFEDGPQTTIWIVCTTAPQKILPTVRRRCYTVRVAGLSDAAMMRLLKRAWRELKCSRPIEELKETLDRFGVTSPALVLMAAEKFAGGASANEAVMAGDVEADTLEICRALARGDWEAVRRHAGRLNAEEGRSMRLAAMSYFRTMLINERGAAAARAAEAIRILSEYPPIEDPALNAWLASCFYRICARSGKG